MESTILKPGITEEKRTKMILNELNILGKEIENKQVEAQYKANLYRIINTVSSLLIIVSAAVIAGLEAASDCLNIPVLVFSGIIFFTEGTHKLCQWGPQGVLYMNGSIHLKKLQRHVKEYMLFFRRYTAEQLLTLINILREQCDDVDMGLYKLSINGQAHYNTGLDIDRHESTPRLSPFSSTPGDNRSRNDVHIHIDNGQTLGSDTPVLIIPNEEHSISYMGEDGHISSRPIRGAKSVPVGVGAGSIPPSPQITPRIKSGIPTPREASGIISNEIPMIIDVPN